jgi:hypothetical protein
MEIEIENRKTIVGKVLATVIALAMILPLGMMVISGESPEIETQTTQEIHHINDYYAGNTAIRLASAPFNSDVGPANLPPELCIDEYNERVDGYYIVQFNDAVQEMWKARLQQLGAKVAEYVPINAFMVKMSDEVKAQVENLDFVQYVGVYQPAFKIPTHLWNEIPLRDGLHAEDALAYINWQNLFDKAEVIGEGEKMPMSIFLQEDENAYNVAAMIAKAGGTILDVSESSNLVRAEVSLPGIQVLAFVNTVQYVQPYYMPEIHLATATVWEQNKVAGQTPVWDQGLFGDGMIVATSDTGLDTDHEQFRDPAWPPPPDWTGPSPGHRKVVRYEQWADNAVDEAASQHGTHTAGYCVGNGTYVGSSHADRHGMAPSAKISFHDIGASDDTLRGIPADLKDMFQIQYDDGARLNSNSWGVHVVSPTGSRTLSEGKYTEDAMNSDWFMWLNKDFQVFFSAGNDRNAGAADRPDLYPYPATVSPPATGKNLVSVGAHQSGGSWQNMESYSSFGPTLHQNYDASVPAEYFAAFINGRLKPDVCSDGSVSSARGDGNRDGNEDNLYGSMSGTSTSGPVCMGGATLIYQYFQDGYWPFDTVQPVAANAFTPSAALVKAALLNGARDSTSGSGANSHPYEIYGHSMAYPNNDQGWGMTDIGDSLYFIGESREMELDDNQVGLITDQYREYEFWVDGGPLEITLVWTDYKGSAATQGQLVNDLNLNVTAPNGITYYWGNNFGTSSRQSDSGNPIGQFDDINNVEGVLINSPTSGIWTVNVSAANIPVGPQPYALVMTGNFGDTYGWVKMDKSVYAPGDTVNLEVKDTDGWDGNGGLPVTVTLVSSTNDKETITLNEAGANARRFTGSIVTNLLDIAQEDGQISIEHGGLLTVYYNESTPSHVSTAIATTDAAGPQITNVRVTDISNTLAIVRWTSDVPSTSQVYYGETPALGSISPLDGDMVLEHQVPILGLNAFTDYYFDVESVSIGGVTTRDTNGGDHYMFTTVDNADVMIIQEHSDVESSDQQVNDWRLSLDYYGWSYVVWETVKYGLPSVAAMNTAKCVYWDVGEGYPQLGGDERAIIQTWVNQVGKQLWYQTGQDVSWDMSSDGNDGPGTDVDNAWRQNYLRADYQWDDADGGGGNEGAPFQIVGTTHPISSSYPGAGVGQDLEQDIYGSTRFWPDDLTNNQGGDSPAPWDYNRHHSPSPGDCGGIAYDGASYKLAYEGYAHAMVQDDGTFGTAGNVFGEDLNMDRATIADETLIWLFGEDHPDITVIDPNGGETVSATYRIDWSIANANSIDIQISRDGGQSWVVEAIGLPGGSTFYDWDTTTSGTYGPGLDFPNGEFYRVKVLGYGATLKGFDISDANFTVMNGGGDDTGPMVIAGSVKPTPIPVWRGKPLNITATADDRFNGNSDIAQMEFYVDGITPTELIGDMAPVDVFDSPIESAHIDYQIPVLETLGLHTVYVRARDSYNNWGGFESADFYVIQGEDTPPVADLTAPDGGEMWMGGSSQNIVWDMLDAQTPMDQLVVDLYYSTNSGATFPNTIVTGLSGFLSNPCTYNWNPVDSVDSTQVRVRVIVTDTDAMTDQDDSLGDFTIDSTAPGPATNPHAELTGANDVTISWGLSADDGGGFNDVDRYEVWFITNGWDPTGNTYASLSTEVPGTTSYVHVNRGAANAGSYCYQLRTYDTAGHETRTTIQAAKYGTTLALAINPSHWWLVGSNIVQSSTSIDHVVQGLGLPGAGVMAWDAVNQKWLSDRTGRPDSLNDLTDITNEMGFWLEIDANTRFCTAGHIEDMNLNCYAGWNLVPYPYAARGLNTDTIELDLIANCPNYVPGSLTIFDYTQPYYIRAPASDTLSNNEVGFWIEVTADCTWTVINY